MQQLGFTFGAIYLRWRVLRKLRNASSVQTSPYLRHLCAARSSRQLHVWVSHHEVEREESKSFTENAVASFFTPMSQKPPEKIIWQERAPNDDTPKTLLVGKYEPSDMSNSGQTSQSYAAKRRKVAAFDFVSYTHVHYQAASDICFT